MKALFSPTDAGPIGDVEVGMPVIDATGNEVGVVVDINMSDPDAITTEGNEYLELDGQLFRVLTALSSDLAVEPRVREPLRTRLVRIGFVKVEGHGPVRKVHYVRADRIARVIDGHVELSVGSHEVDTEG
jgi:hypothetical protein